jgi:hypothetical protein
MIGGRSGAIADDEAGDPIICDVCGKPLLGKPKKAPKHKKRRIILGATTFREDGKTTFKPKKAPKDKGRRIILED